MINIFLFSVLAQSKIVAVEVETRPYISLLKSTKDAVENMHPLGYNNSYSHIAFLNVYVHYF